MVRSVSEPRRWRTAFATSIGTSHVKTGTPCQDAGACTVVELLNGQEILIAAVSDGAGTADKSDLGSALAVQEFVDQFSQAIPQDGDLGLINEEWVRTWFKGLQVKISDLAEENGDSVAAYACTLLGVVAGHNEAVYVQLGDGAIVVEAEGDDDYGWIFWPQHGEYANSTFFVTQEGAETKLQIERGPAPREVALFSDGIERLVLDMAKQSVHSPAFKPIFEWLAGTEPDRTGKPSPALEAYLASDHVNRRTDDDKTLVMATRAEHVPAP